MQATFFESTENNFSIDVPYQEKDQFKNPSSHNTRNTSSGKAVGKAGQ